MKQTGFSYRRTILILTVGVVPSEFLDAQIPKCQPNEVVERKWWLLFQVNNRKYYSMSHRTLLNLSTKLKSQYEEGRRCAAVDLEYGGASMDFLHPEGFVHCLYQVLRLKNGASLTMAPVCSTWVWMILSIKQIGN